LTAFLHQLALLGSLSYVLFCLLIWQVQHVPMFSLSTGCHY
jgi:hypothetical protein